MTSLLIDNYDSFTYNLFHLIAEVYGAEPLVVRNDDPLLDELPLVRFAEIFLSPGPGRPERPRDFGACARAITSGVPVLGVCLGHQGICQIFGGCVESVPEPVHGRISDIHHCRTGLFAGIPSPFKAVRYHSRVVTRTPPELDVLARTGDGAVMAVAHRHLPVFGVQFHPESICTEHGAALIANFRELSQKASQHARGQLETSGRPSVHRQSVITVSSAPKVDPAIPSKCYRLAWRRISLAPDPEDVFIRLFADSECAFWLDGAADEQFGLRFSYMGDGSGPHAAHVTRDAWRDVTTVRDRRGSHLVEAPLLTYIGRELDARHVAAEQLPFEFNLGYVGYLGYELKAECGGARAHRSPTPDAALIFVDRMIVFDHHEQAIYLICLVDAKRPCSEESWLDQTALRLHQQDGRTAPAQAPGIAAHAGATTECEQRHDQRSYLKLIRACQREIRAGESYEICLTNMTTIRASIDPLATFRELRRTNPAPYSSLLKLPGLAVISSSPERFLAITAAGQVESKPIKGTARRGRTQREDESVCQELRKSEKNQAENLMIVDLVRHDLGAVCKAGSVHVHKLFDVESYATVHQLVSTVRGQLHPEHSAIDCVRAAFPGGSMTGAPKIRTMEIIDRFEQGARGVYSGALGWFGLSGALDLGMVIRTIVATDEEVSFGTGGAIVALSDPEAELAEARLKGEVLLHAMRLTGDLAPDITKPRSVERLSQRLRHHAEQPQSSSA